MAEYLVVPLLQKKQEIRIDEITITPENQNILLNSTYQDCLVFDLTYALSLSSMPSARQTIAEKNYISLQDLCEKHQHAIARIVLQKMGPAGFGVFLSPGETLDPQLDCFIYSGLYTRLETALSRQSDKSLQLQQQHEKILIIGEGQTTGYIQQLPEKHTVPDDLMQMGAATENLFHNSPYLYIDKETVAKLKHALCIPIRCLAPKTRIEAGNKPLLLGFNYSVRYWFVREKSPLFFDHYGNPLAQQPYLLSLQTKKHSMTIAYATKEAVIQLCTQQYFLLEDALILFNQPKIKNDDARFVAICASHVITPKPTTTLIFENTDHGITLKEKIRNDSTVDALYAMSFYLAEKGILLPLITPARVDTVLMKIPSEFFKSLDKEGTSIFLAALTQSGLFSIYTKDANCSRM